MAFSVETALCIVVPESLTSWIQQCRSQHDKAYKRWPPHINLLFPFLPERDFAAALPRIKEAVGKLPKIQLKLHQTSFFKHGPRKWVLILKPEEVVPGSLDALQMTVFKLYPHLKKQRDFGGGKFTPHVTLGQFQTQADMEAKMAELAKCPALEFELDAICMIARQGDVPFELKHKAELGTSASAISSVAAFSNNDDDFGGLFSSQSIAISDFPTEEAQPEEGDDTWGSSWGDSSYSATSSTTTTSTKATKTKAPFKSSYYKDKPSPLTSTSTTSPKLTTAGALLAAKKEARAASSPSKTSSLASPSAVSSLTSPSATGYTSQYQLSAAPSSPSKFMTTIEPPSAPKFNTTFSTITTTTTTTANTTTAVSITSPSTLSTLSMATSSFKPSKPPAPIVIASPTKVDKPKVTSSYYATKKARIGRTSTMDDSPLTDELVGLSLLSQSNEYPVEDYPEPAPVVTHKVILTRVSEPIPIDTGFEPVVHHITKWLTTMEEARRPKTPQKLGNAISKMCSISIDGMAPNKMLSTLVEKGYLTAAGDKIKILKKGDKSTQRYNLGLTRQIQYPSDEAMVLDRCTNWIMDPDNLPKTKAALMNTITQLVKIKKTIDPSTVVRHLAESGHISVLQDERGAQFLEYHM